MAAVTLRIAVVIAINLRFVRTCPLGIITENTKVILPNSMTRDRRQREQISSDYNRLVTESMDYGTDCPTQQSLVESTNSTSPVYARANCPWFFKLRHDPDRFPASFLVAVLRCGQRCQGLPEAYSDNFRCAYVFHTETVLRRTNFENNRTGYVEHIERLPVGATCVWKKERT